MGIGAWTRGYQRAWLRLDILAGLTVTAILIPEGMAYAQLAGVPPQAAFYAAPAVMLLYALLGSSRQLVVAVSSAVAITSAATITELATPGTARYLALTASLALLAGLISVLAGLLKLGRIAQFFSASVLVGFVFALALIISAKQIPKILGIEVEAHNFFAILWESVRHLGDTSLVTLAVGAAGIAAMIAIEHVVPKLPAALAVLIGSLVASNLLHLADHGVAVVGELPSGLVAPSLPHTGWSVLPLLAIGAGGIALLAFAEAMGPAQQMAKEHGYRIDPDRELIAIGASNLGAGLFQGFPVGASLSKTAANERAGAHTPMSLVVAALGTALVAVLFTPLFTNLPEATLGAIVIVAVSEMERIAPIRRLWDLRRADAVLALVALFGVLLLDIIPGLALAVITSLGVVVWRAGEARLQVIGRPSPDPEDKDHRHHRMPPGLLLVRPQEMLFFVNAAQIVDAVDHAASSEPRPQVVVLDLGLTPDVDVPTLDALLTLRQRLHDLHIELWIVSAITTVRHRLRAVDLANAVAPPLFHDVAGALLAYLDIHGDPGADVRRDVLGDVLDIISSRRSHPGLDDPGRAALGRVEAQLRAEMDREAGPEVGPPV